MTQKEIFLTKLASQIKILQAAYEQNKLLPDYFFEYEPSNNSISKPVDKPSANVGNMSSLKTYHQLNNASHEDDPNTKDLPQGYGANRKILMSIFEDHGKAIVKNNIVDMFAERLGVDPKSVYNTVTNGLATLTEDGIIRGHKPIGLKFKGYFWTLASWWEGDKLPLKYEPFSGKLLM